MSCFLLQSMRWTETEPRAERSICASVPCLGALASLCLQDLIVSGIGIMMTEAKHPTLWTPSKL